MAERSRALTGFTRELGFADHKHISKPLLEFWSTRMTREAFLRCLETPQLAKIATEFLQERGEEFWGPLQDRPFRYPQQSDEIRECLVKILRQQRHNQQDCKRRGYGRKKGKGKGKGKRKEKKNNPRQETMEANGDLNYEPETSRCQTIPPDFGSTEPEFPNPEWPAYGLPAYPQTDNDLSFLDDFEMNSFMPSIDPGLDSTNPIIVHSTPTQTADATSIGTAELGSIGAPRQNESNVIEILAGQADTERVRLDAEQEIPEQDTSDAPFDSGTEHEALHNPTALLLSCNGGKSLSLEEHTVLGQLIVSHKLEVTFDAERFWKSIWRYSRSTENSREGRETNHLVIVDPNVKNMTSTSMSFTSSALEQQHSIINTCPPCRIVFVAWDAIGRLCASNKRLAELWTTEAPMCMNVANGTASLTGLR